MTKKLFCLVLMLVIALSTFACGEYKGIENKPPVTPPSSTPSVGGNDGDNYFSVKLEIEEYDSETKKWNKVQFLETDGVEAIWTDGTSIHTATFNEDGVAKVKGLDGDYNVTLNGLDGYMYDPNIYSANSDKPDITIEVFEHNTTKGKGNDKYNEIQLNRVGAYTVEIPSKTKTVWFSFSPTRQGTYIIETIADINLNVVNPKFMVIEGNNSQYKENGALVDDGGSSSYYTRNPMFVYNVDRTNIGGEKTFGISATHRDDVYPITINFLIRRVGSYEYPYTERTPIYADMEDLTARGKIDNAYLLDGGTTLGTLTYPEVQIDDSPYYRFDGKMWKLHPEQGIYRRYYSDTDTWGEILYAHIIRRHRFFAFQDGQEIHFQNVQSVGNAALTVSDGTEDHTAFIDQYASMIDNNYGVYPVTEEMQVFLQKFSVSQRYYMDGNGWAETTAEGELGHRIYSTEQDQWLFACCYFKK